MQSIGHVGKNWVYICKLWCDQAKSVWSRSNSVFIFLTNGMHHFHSYILQKTPLKLVNWFQRYEQFKDAKNNRKQKTFSALFGSILKSLFPTSDWFCLTLCKTLPHGWLAKPLRIFFFFLNQNGVHQGQKFATKLEFFWTLQVEFYENPIRFSQFC